MILEQFAASGELTSTLPKVPEWTIPKGWIQVLPPRLYAHFKGEGLADASTRKVEYALAAFDGLGTATAVANPIERLKASFDGSGDSSALIHISRFWRDASFDGSGSATGDITSTGSAIAPFSGSGDATGFAREFVMRDALFDSEGVASGSSIPVGLVKALFDGLGTASGAVRQISRADALFDGSGDATATRKIAYKRDAFFDGSGDATGSIRPPAYVDDFERPDAPNLGPSWTQWGGGSIKIVGGTAYGHDLPSVPLSYAMYNLPLNAGDQSVSAILSENCIALHSTSSVWLRAKQDRTQMVEFMFLTDQMYITYTNASGPVDGSVPFSWIVTKSTVAADLALLKAGAEVRLTAVGEIYTVYIAGREVMRTWIPDNVISTSNRYSGICMQDDSAVGNYEPPTNFASWRAENLIPADPVPAGWFMGDHFHRENGSLGPSWSPGSAATIISKRVEASSTGGAAEADWLDWWGGPLNTEDMTVYAALVTPTIAPDGLSGAIAVRGATNGGIYQSSVIALWTTGGKVYLYTVANGALTQRAVSTANTPASIFNDGIALQAKGTVYTAYINGNPFASWNDTAGVIPVGPSNRIFGMLMQGAAFNGWKHSPSIDSIVALTDYGRGGSAVLDPATASALSPDVSASGSFSPSGMYKNGSQPLADASWNDIAGWTADTGNYPGSTVNADGKSLVSNGTKASATLAASVPFSLSTGSGTTQIRILVNGVVVVTGTAFGNNFSGGTVTASTVRDINNGDLVRVQMQNTAGALGTITSGTNTYLRIT